VKDIEGAWPNAWQSDDVPRPLDDLRFTAVVDFQHPDKLKPNGQRKVDEVPPGEQADGNFGLFEVVVENIAGERVVSYCVAFIEKFCSDCCQMRVVVLPVSGNPGTLTSLFSPLKNGKGSPGSVTLKFTTSPT
jgi:hypothetical protein